MLTARDYVLIFKSTFLRHLESSYFGCCDWGQKLTDGTCGAWVCIHSSEFPLQSSRCFCCHGSCIGQFRLLGICLMPFPHSLSFDVNFTAGNKDPFNMYKTFICNILPFSLLSSETEWRLQVLMKNLSPSCFIKALVRWCLGWVEVKVRCLIVSLVALEASGYLPFLQWLLSCLSCCCVSPFWKRVTAKPFLFKTLWPTL